VPVPGLGVSLFWGTVNFLLIGVAILAAAELPEWRRTFRVRHRLPCELIRGAERFHGLVMDLNETGALLKVNRQLMRGDGRIICSIRNQEGVRVIVNAEICRSAPVSSTAVEIGVKFVDVDRRTTEALIVAAFADPRAWNQPQAEPGIWQSMWSVLRVYKKLLQRFRKSRRRELRIPSRQRCRLVLPDRMMEGTIEQISETGLLLNLPGPADQVGEQGTVLVKGLELKVRRCWARQSGHAVLAGFLVERVDRGADRWRSLYQQAA
jgi:hypothetical protein